ncbi:MAG: ZIP family metal transporter, partial [Muribaculaceae bacterium]|nr:ZIP family metal transporter [Muribaculaceae bacterium]
MFNQLLICAAGLGLASLLGSGVGMIVRKIPHKLNDIFLGFCAGMMLTASIVCLIVPSVDMVGLRGCWQPLAGITLGVLMVAVLDRLTPHLHHIAGVD